MATPLGEVKVEVVQLVEHLIHLIDKIIKYRSKLIIGVHCSYAHVTHIVFSKDIVESFVDNLLVIPFSPSRCAQDNAVTAFNGEI